MQRVVEIGLRMHHRLESSQRTVLIISQVYVPDPAAVGQYMHDAAAEMVRRGYQVVVLTSARGYEDPARKFPPRETIDGVDVRRLPLSSFGKKSIFTRLVAQCSFVVQAAVRGILMRRLGCVLVSTSPPMAGAAALLIRFFRRVPIKFWVMDLNPDQLIEMGRLGQSSLPARAFNLLNKLLLQASDDVIALDRFMADRLIKKLDVRDKITILPPWPHSNHLEPIEHIDNSFRQEYRLEGKFVVMYSGNHGRTTPVKTVLDAAVRMQDEKDLVFMFIGGGIGKREVAEVIERHHPSNIFNLPYQPFNKVRYSLSAADVHVVTMGDNMAGVIHPSKVYGAMALARPILLIGPNPCHVSDIMQAQCIGWHIRHGDVDGAIAAIDTLRTMDAAELKKLGDRARQIILEEFGRDKLLAQFCEVVVRGTAIANG